jgi:hypothetical protein
MKQLSEFETIEDARIYEHTAYRKISGNEANQFFGIMGVLNFIENNQANETVVEVITGVPTTIGQVCKSTIVAMNGPGFETNPNEDDGKYNRAAANLIGLPQQIIDTFFAKGEVKSKPYENVTEYDWKIARDDTINHVSLTVNGGYVVINVTSECEKHNPKIYGTRTNPRTGKTETQRINNFYDVADAGKYDAKVPPNWLGASFFVDDAYGVIEAA